MNGKIKAFLTMMRRDAWLFWLGGSLTYCTGINNPDLYFITIPLIFLLLIREIEFGEDSHGR